MASRQEDFVIGTGEVTEDLDGSVTSLEHRPEENVALSDPMSWYPPLAAPRGSKKDIFQVDKYKVIDERARKAERRLIKSFRDLANYLTTGLTSDLAKVRSIFSWMGAQQLAMGDAEAYSTQPDPSSPEFVMKEAAQGKREAFAILFTLLCRKAGVACLTVRGLVKAAAYVPGQLETCGKSVWTVAHVGAGGWRHVYPLWAFRFVQNYSHDDRWTEVEEAGLAKRQRQTKDQGEVKGHVDEFWFLTDPEDFNFLCHADEKEAGGAKQLLAEPWSTELFLGLPGLKVELFKSRWKLLSPNSALVEAKNGKCSFDFQHPKECKGELTYKLFFDETTSKGELPTTLQSEVYVTRLKAASGIISLVARLPVAGLYRLLVSGVLDNGPPALLAQFCLQCKDVDSKARPFPSNPDNGFGFDEVSEAAGITNPSQTEGMQLVKKGQSLDFSFEVDERRELLPQLKNGLKRPEELACHISLHRDRNHVRVGVHLPKDDSEPEYSLEIYLGGLQNSGGGAGGEVKGSARKSENGAKGTAIEDGGERCLSPVSAKDLDIITNSGSPPPAKSLGGLSSLSSPADSKTMSREWSEIKADVDSPSNARQGGDYEISNPYKGGNSQLMPASQGSGSSMGLLVNALNYLLTADKQLHDESSNENKELHRELQEALDSGDEAAIRASLRRFLDAGLDNPVAVAKAKARERVWDETREKLQKAAQEARSFGRINSAIGDFKHNRMEDQGELQGALERLLSLSERNVKSALSRSSLPELDTALRRVRSSHVGRRARSTEWFREAETYKTNRTVRQLCEDVAARLGTPGVLGLGMEDRPVSRQLQRTLSATLALLGDDLAALKSTQAVKNRVRATSAGRSQLLERIRNFSVTQTSKQHVQRADRELRGCSGPDLERTSGTVARRLHDWCQNMVRELSFHIWNDDTVDDDEEDDENDADSIIYNNYEQQ